MYLIDGHNNGHLSSLGVADGFQRLRSYSIICCHNNDGNVRHSSSSCSHCTESLKGGTNNSVQAAIIEWHQQDGHHRHAL